MSLSKLSKLPPEVLSSVLNNEAMPLSRRLRLRLLCNRWADIIEDGLKKVTSLVIRDENVYIFEPEPVYLILQSTDQTDEFTRPLSRLFTSLTKLIINFWESISLSKVPSLLTHLDTTNLTTLKLYGICDGNEYYTSFYKDEVAVALTALPALTSLTLLGFGLSPALLPHLEPVISRLEKFGCLDSVYYSDNFGDIISSRLSPRCTHLWLDSEVLESFDSSFLDELSSNLTHLHLDSCVATTWQSISQIHGLSSLTLEFYAYYLDSSMLLHLRPFPRLTQVKLLGLKYHAPLALPSKKETLLSTIERLTLQVDFGDSAVDYQYFFQTIFAWFPALLQLTIFTEQDTIPALQASLGKLSFSVEIGDFYSGGIWGDW